MEYITYMYKYKYKMKKGSICFEADAENNVMLLCEVYNSELL